VPERKRGEDAQRFNAAANCETRIVDGLRGESGIFVEPGNSRAGAERQAHMQRCQNDGQNLTLPKRPSDYLEAPYLP
jgi:hypothetical protein